MERAFLMALTFAATASAVSYVDYSGVKMPQYGSNSEYETGRDPLLSHASEDYHGHSPDAPASLDYKYEEEPRIKTKNSIKDVDELDRWRKSPRKQKEFIRSAEIDNIRKKLNRDDDDVEETSKLRSNGRFSKHRSRFKTEEDLSGEQILSKRHSKSRQERKDISDIDSKDYFHLDKGYIREDDNKEFEYDIKFRETTVKSANRRRPRERQFDRQQKVLDEYEEDLEADGQNMSYFEKEDKERHPEDNLRRLRPTIQQIPSTRVRYDEADKTRNNPTKESSGKNIQKGYNDYEDYYDMKRAHNIKNKLPTLSRRTTVSESATKMRQLNTLLTHRRLMVTAPESISTTRKLTGTTTQSTTVTPTIPVTTSTTNTVKTKLINKDMNLSQELSLAEKSRLSILKKAQRKEAMGFNSTKKPPVLLQVTNHMPTVVMIEPPSSSIPWMRTREFLEDSPERIEKVKRLMRHKLVVEAKSIHDLTDNWDEMVCDYIDTSLLENKSVVFPSNALLLIFYLQLYLFVIN